MKILHRYILKELRGPFLASLIISTIILAAGNIIQVVDMVMNKGVEAVQVLRIFICLLPYVFTFTIPISVLSAVMLGFGRLSSDNEITALRTSGITFRDMVFPVILMGLVISLANVPLNDKVLPQSEFTVRKLVKQIGMRHPTAMLEPGVFVKGFQDYVVFIYGLRGNTLYNVHIYQPRENGPTRTIVAKRAEVIADPKDDFIKLRLYDGTADEIAADKPDEFYKASFERYELTLNVEQNVDLSKIEKKAREKSIKELLADIKKASEQKTDVIPFKIEIHKKIALAFSNLVFVLIGIPLAIKTNRREKFIGFGLAMLLFLLYWGIMLAGIAFSIRSIVPPWVGVWSANILLSAIAVLMMFRMRRT
jgi:lipopolysaccharide export system permease protein